VPSHAPITEITWLVVFDGGRAAVFVNEGFADSPNLRLVFGAENEDRERHDDRPGRYPTPAGGRTAVEAFDRRTEAELRFTDGIAKRLEVAAAEGRFDRLVVVAPAKLLTRFRARAPRARIAGELSGDFVHAPIDVIERAFRQALAART
jgi:protein required for attachment to host cells